MTMTQDQSVEHAEQRRARRDFPALDRQDEDQLLPQLVAHLREHRTRLRQEWASRIQESICCRR